MIFKTQTQTNEKLSQLRERLNEALVGKADVVEMVIACILAKGHLLFDDLPGQDHPVEGAGELDRCKIRSSSMYSGSASQRHLRIQHLQSEDS